MTTQYTLPDLGYDYGALEPHISGQIMELHHDKHHATYVKGANTALEELETARAEDDFDAITRLQTNLAPDGGGSPEGAVAEQLERDFGGFDRFKAHMTKAANTIQGSGWALASW